MISFDVFETYNDRLMRMRYLETSISESIYIEGAAVLFAEDEKSVTPNAVNEFIVFEAFSGENEEMYLESLKSILEDVNLGYASATQVDVISPVQSPSSSSSSWSDYGLYIIIASCTLVTMAVIIFVYNYAIKRREKKESVSHMGSEEKVAKEMSYSRKRFFEKTEPEIDNEVNTDPLEFEHNLHEIKGKSNKEQNYKGYRCYLLKLFLF